MIYMETPETTHLPALDSVHKTVLAEMVEIVRNSQENAENAPQPFMGLPGNLVRIHDRLARLHVILGRRRRASVNREIIDLLREVTFLAAQGSLFEQNKLGKS